MYLVFKIQQTYMYMCYLYTLLTLHMWVFGGVGVLWDHIIIIEYHTIKGIQQHKVDGS